MSERSNFQIISPVWERPAPLALPEGSLLENSMMLPDGNLRDGLNRPLHDLRISVTDRCNFRCSYCMPKEVYDRDHPYLPHDALLTFEEITRIAKIFISHGVQKIRLTGGEPLLRKKIESLIEQLANLQTINGKPLDITLTTNGSLLARKAQSLKDAGLGRITVSLDSLDDAIFRKMNDVDFPVASVLEGIESAQRVGLGPVKINMVVKRDTNVNQILPMSRHFRGSGLILRFIEFMDVGLTNGWSMDNVVPSDEIVELVRTEMPLLELPANSSGETAKRFGYLGTDGKHDINAGEIGFVSSVTKAFCSDCNRARLSTEGQLYLCLFASRGYDLRELLRNGASDRQITSALAHIWAQRQDRYSQLRGQLAAANKGAENRIEMSYIGG